MTYCFLFHASRSAWFIEYLQCYGLHLVHIEDFQAAVFPH